MTREQRMRIQILILGSKGLKGNVGNLPQAKLNEKTVFTSHVPGAWV